jgi:excisionase family DNA binding protein
VRKADLLINRFRFADTGSVLQEFMAQLRCGQLCWYAGMVVTVRVGSETAPEHERKSVDGREGLLSQMETPASSLNSAAAPEPERLAYSVQESADLLGVDYFSVYRLIQRGKLRACRALRGKLLVPRAELVRLLKG